MLTETLIVEEVDLNGTESGTEFDELLRLNHSQEAVKALEAWYSSDFQSRVTEIVRVLQAQIAEELRQQFKLELEARVNSLRNDYEEQIYQQAAVWESDRAALRQEIESLRKRIPARLVEEIAAAEANLHKKDVELTKKLSEDSFALGAILQLKTERLELDAYLRGLTFRSANA
jgi:hypothetical protein